MMQKINKSLFAFLLISLILPNLALASWWNPFSWFERPPQVLHITNPITPPVTNNTNTKTKTTIKLPRDKKTLQITPKPIIKKIPSETISTESLVLGGSSNLNGKVGEYFNYSFSASGGLPPYHYQLESEVGFPPMGIVLDTNGRLSGTPSIERNSTFSLCVVDTAGKSKCQTVSIEVKPADKPIHSCEDCKGPADACYYNWHEVTLKACRAESNTPEHYSDPNWYNDNCYDKIPQWQAPCDEAENACNLRNEGCQ